MSDEKERNSSVELLRIVIMLMIISSHFATHGGFSFVGVSIPRLWWNVIEMGGSIANIVFILISGYFLIQKDSLKVNINKILKLAGTIVFYSMSLFLVSFVLNKEYANKYNLLKCIFPIENDQWWFATTYFILYLIHPYVNKLLLNLTKKQYQTYIIFGYLIFGVIPGISLGTSQVSSILEFILFYSIGGYIKIFGLYDNVKSKTWLKWTFLLGVIKYLLYFVPNAVTFKHGWVSAHFAYVYNMESIFTIIQSTCLFMAFIKMNIKYSFVINKIASTAFGVYLIHDSGLLRPIIWKDIFKVAAYQNTTLIIPYSVIVTLIVFVSCSLIDLIRQLIFEKPYLKFVDSYIEKMEKHTISSLIMLADSLIN